MDESNIKTAEKRFINGDHVSAVKAANGDLQGESEKQHEQFINNNITMANNWIGVAGDSFMYASNTLSAYLGWTMKFYESNVNLLDAYKLTFDNIDDQLTRVANVNEG